MLLDGCFAEVLANSDAIEIERVTDNDGRCRKGKRRIESSKGMRSVELF
jgi:hypothetical protein